MLVRQVRLSEWAGKIQKGTREAGGAVRGLELAARATSTVPEPASDPFGWDNTRAAPARQKTLRKRAGGIGKPENREAILLNSISAILRGGVLARRRRSGKLIIGSKDELYYFGSATDAEAQALAQSLKSFGFLRDRGVSVFLSKGNGATAISFVLAEGAWDDPQTVPAFSGSPGRRFRWWGLPIKLRLVEFPPGDAKRSAGEPLIEAGRPWVLLDETTFSAL